jgi:hypothetical protein
LLYYCISHAWAHKMNDPRPRKSVPSIYGTYAGVGTRWKSKFKEFLMVF